MQNYNKTIVVEREIIGAIYQYTSISYFFLAEVKVVTLRNQVVLVFRLNFGDVTTDINAKEVFQKFNHF